MRLLHTGPALLVLVWFAGCATTATPAPTDTGTGDTPTDFGDIVGDTIPDGLPPDTTIPDTLPPDVPGETTPDVGPDTATGGVVGDPCYSASQCGGVPGAGVTCLTSIMGYITFPGGYCSAVCTSDMDCGTGGACVNISDLGRYCLKRCASIGECRSAEGYDCVSVPGTPGTFCLPPFTSPDATG